MGDRANVCVKDFSGSKVYLYTHYGGMSLPLVVKAVLQRKLRWDDAPYLARMVFCRMVSEDIAGETGYGISATICDNQHHIIVLDIQDQKILFVREEDHRKGDDSKPLMVGSFEKYCELSNKEIEDYWRMS